MEDLQSLFQQTYVEPALQSYEQQVLPAIQQRFVDADAGSSSALNQALAKSAGDLSTALGSQFGQLFQSQQGMQQNALNQFLPLLTGQTFQPIYQQQQGLAGPLIGAAGQLGGGYLMSSELVKENIRPYMKGLRELHNLSVKQYDYIPSAGGDKNRVGLIAEDVPLELTKNIDGILNVDVYGIMGLLINAVQELSFEVNVLKEKNKEYADFLLEHEGAM